MGGQEQARLPVPGGECGVSPGPYRPGLRSPSVQGGGVRLSKPLCLMALLGQEGHSGGGSTLTSEGSWEE